MPCLPGGASVSHRAATDAARDRRNTHVLHLQATRQERCGGAVRRPPGRPALLVRDFSPDEFKNNVLALADIARFFNLPTILTTSFEDGPNGPLVPELKEMFPQAPYIARPGNINAWDNEDFVKAVKATGKKQLIIAGVVTDVA